MSTPPITVLIHHRAQPGREDVAMRELNRLADIVVAREPACLGITISQDLSDPTRILLYERWTDKAAYVGPHMQTPHLQDFIQRSRDFLAGPPEITFWREVADATPRE